MLLNKRPICGVHAAGNLSKFAVFSKKSLISPLAINAALFWLHCLMIQPSLDHKPSNQRSMAMKSIHTVPVLQSSSAHDHLKSQRIYSKNTCWNPSHQKIGTFLLKGQLSSCGHCCQGARPHPPANHLLLPNGTNTWQQKWSQLIDVKQVAKHFPPGPLPMSSGQDFDSVQTCQTHKMNHLPKVP